MIWGKGNPQPEINYDKTPDNITACDLYDYETSLKKINAYGEFFNYIRSLNYSDVTHWLPFPYDWRQDIRKSASNLDTFIKGKKDKFERAPFGKRNIIFIAHSMGGLVVTYWYHHHYKGNEKDYPFAKINQFIFLGTPHSGAPSILSTILKGYDTHDSWVPKVILNFVVSFDNLDKAACSFPSIFQLLPRDGHIYARKPTDTGQRQQGYRDNLTPVSVFDYAPWKEFDLCRHADNKKEYYEKYFHKGYLENARDFHVKLKNWGPVPNAVYFFSKSHDTDAEIVLNEDMQYKYKQGGYNPILYPNGDGRVPMAIAKNNALELRPETHVSHLVENKDHGSLMDGESFTTYIDGLCTDYENASQANYGLRLFSGETPEVTLLADNSAGGAPAMNTHFKLIPINYLSSDQHAMQTIFKYNKALSDSKYGQNDTKSQKEFYKNAEAVSETKKPSLFWSIMDIQEEMISSYSMALAIDNTSGHAYHAANNLGFYLLEQNKSCSSVIKVLKLATGLNPIPDRKDESATPKMRAITYNNLGVAYERCAQFDEARENYQKAIDINKHYKAINNLKILEKKSGIKKRSM